MKGGRVVELAAGHALVSHLLLLLDPSFEGALSVDAKVPASAARLAAVFASRWPRLEGRVHVLHGDLARTEIREGDLVVSVHACGSLTDVVLGRALAARARAALLPCCHDARCCDTGGLEGVMDVALAIDATRVGRLRAHGYHVHTQTIPRAITPMNRLLLGWPPAP